MSKTTVIYHRADSDGIFCREIAKKFLPEAELIGWDHGDAPLEIPDGQIYILDLPVDRVFGFKYEAPDVDGKPPQHPAGLVWIDHHKSSIETHPKDIPGYRIDGVAACRLAWQWFLLHAAWDPREQHPPGDLPSLEDFVERTVSEPWAVRLAGEYDIWDKRDPDAELFQHGLRSRDLTNDWRMLFITDGKMTINEIEQLVDVGHREILNPDGTVRNPIVLGLLEAGKSIHYSQTRSNESIIKEIGFTFQWEGLTFLGCNAARYNSHLFTAGLKPEHDGCFGFKWTGKEWSVSLYGVPGKPEVDLSKIAVKYGGGGHKQACGFRTNELPFVRLLTSSPTGSERPNA